MAWYPKAVKRPISVNFTRTKTKKNCVILHSTASKTATSMYGWFSNPSAEASSHFHIDNVGRVEQYIDTDHFSWANREGNSRSITVETQGSGYEQWTNAQIVAIVDLIVWASKVHGIPIRMMNSSKSSESGVGWHRLGIDGNYIISKNPDLLKGRTPRGGGEVWSGFGKICPGDDRILQMPSIVEKAKKQAGISTTPVTPNTAPSAPLGLYTYTVKKGDTLWKIAQAHSTTVDRIKKDNGLSSDEILVGQKIKVVGGGIYVVAKGDTLWSIAKKVGTTVANLMKLNSLKSSSIGVGDTLKTGGSASTDVRTHTVKKGDTLWSIAEKYGADVHSLRKLNGMTGSVIQIGQVIKIK